jgi:hypothetical protein
MKYKSNLSIQDVYENPQISCARMETVSWSSDDSLKFYKYDLIPINIKWFYFTGTSKNDSKMYMKA